MRHPAAAAVERHVRQLGVGDQHVDIRDGVLTVALDQSSRGPLHHVDGSLILGHVMAELRRAEHQVVAQVVGLGELGVILGADRLPRQIRRDVNKTDWPLLVHGILISSRPG